ncbi:LuxR family transcriptional regulator [Dasania marina]|uniref:LuxR family transcriptional regulator n=1 Tax=Dasania marina TaxID=471499 RepID=UPI00036A9AF9|nr:LuxR family transcriptional regulator [Dasania marina]
MSQLIRDKLCSPQWYQQIASTTQAIGSELWGKQLLDAIGFLVTADAPVLIIYPHNSAPSTVYLPDNDGPWAPSASLDNYYEGAYLLDPFYQASRSGCATKLYRLSEVVPDLFHKSEYYFNYYQHCQLVDEFNYLVQLPQQQTASLSLASKTPFSDEQAEVLHVIAPWVTSVIAQHFSAQPQPQGKPGFHQNIASAFTHFGSSVLTARECEVAQHILHGYSTKAMASKLLISMETVKVHRRHLYQKLDISSQPELFSLFIGSLASGEKQLGVDPLKDYI